MHLQSLPKIYIQCTRETKTKGWFVLVCVLACVRACVRRLVGVTYTYA